MTAAGIMHDHRRTLTMFQPRTLCIQSARSARQLCEAPFFREAQKRAAALTAADKGAEPRRVEGEAANPAHALDVEAQLRHEVLRHVRQERGRPEAVDDRRQRHAPHDLLSQHGEPDREAELLLRLLGLALVQRVHQVLRLLPRAQRLLHRVDADSVP